ncbi:hypothetical protein GCM10027590_28910 [Nocardiopsis nanhaiensis]
MAEFLDIGEQTLAAAFSEDRSEHLAEQFDVIPELFRNFLPGTVSFCAYRCHGVDPTEFTSGDSCSGLDSIVFAAALTIVPDRSEFTATHAFPDTRSAFCTPSPRGPAPWRATRADQ